ncbi:hypothetical protein KA183_04925 [bacterium]|nr:hypothetical protein [bacterium]QQR56186.1 MAG: hypothetical protein IPG59_14365 [Candidatus Melainabacteria bacterium]
MYTAVIGLSAVIVLVLVLLHLDKKRANARKAHDKKWKEFYSSLLAVAKRASAKAPTDSVAHEMVMDAATRQVLPRNSSGPLRIVGLGDYIRRYQQGIDLVNEADAHISALSTSTSIADFKAPATDVAWKMLWDSILETFLKLSAQKPGDEELHILILEACCHLVLPVNYGGPSRIITRADHVNHYNRGLDIVAQVNQALNQGSA